MSTPRSFIGLGAVNQSLFAIGGYDGEDYLRTVERYDTGANVWSTTAQLNAPRSCCGKQAMMVTMMIMMIMKLIRCCSAAALIDAKGDHAVIWASRILPSIIMILWYLPLPLPHPTRTARGGDPRWPFVRGRGLQHGPLPALGRGLRPQEQPLV
jgi:hypothetical protein